MGVAQSCSVALWDLPGSGIELKSSALTGKFFITEPAGKPPGISI